MLPYVGQFRSSLHWCRCVGSIRGRHTLTGALLKFNMLSGVCLCVLCVYFYVCSPMSYYLWWSHFGHDGSISGHGHDLLTSGSAHGSLSALKKMVLDGQASDPVPVLSGVPQGSVLGPVLFLIFINDLPDNIRSSVRLFADDCVLYRNIQSPIDCQILQDDLNSLAQWETDWQMKFNVAKCHSMRVTQHLPENQIQFEYSLHQQKLEQVHSAKYLCITITDNLDWGQPVSENSCKATNTMVFLRRNLALAPRHTKEIAYETLVRPQLEYAAPIWHPYHETQIAQVEKVQRTAAMWTCRRWRNTSCRRHAGRT